MSGLRFVPVLMVCLPWLVSAQERQGVPDYATHVAPILTRYCAGCHNAQDREGNLSVESFADLQRGGDSGAVWVPGAAASSRLIGVLTGDLEPQMPPEDNDRPSGAEIEVLRTWIDSGAPGPSGDEPRRPPLEVPHIAPRADLDPAITALAISPDGRRLAVGYFEKVELRNRASDQVEQVLAGLPGKVNALYFSAAGDRLVTASGSAGRFGLATLWDVESGKPIREFSAHSDTLYDAELSPDGQLLATCSYDRQVMLWRTDTGEEVRTLAGHNDAVYDLAFSRDGSVLATASGDETVKLWQVETGERLDTLSQPQAEQYVVQFSPDGRYVLAGGADNRIRVWRFVSRRDRRINPLIVARFAHEGAVTGLAFSKDGERLVSVAEDRTVKVWETANYTQQHLFDIQPDQVTDVALDPLDGNLWIGRIDGSRTRYPLVESAATTDQRASPSEPAPPANPSSKPNRVAEHEPNNDIETAVQVYLPAQIEGRIDGEGRQQGDADLFRFSARAGEQWVLEVDAARSDSPLDSHISVLTSDGRPVERVLLRAVRDSYFKFRGKDSSTSDDFRLHNWEEMELNEYLYAAGEVTKLWNYPRGPDSGFQVYPGAGLRYGYFDTTPLSHALHAPCYIVEPHPPGSALISNGLPVFTLYFENDDDGLRELGTDSRLTFKVPGDGEYLARIGDSRGFHGPDYLYTLTIRPRQPDFEVELDGTNPAVNRGSGKEFSVTAQRIDGYEGEIRVDIERLPPGFHASTPTIIERGQKTAFGTIFADADAPSPSAEEAGAAIVTATAQIQGRQVVKQVGSLGEIKLVDPPKLLARIVPADPVDRSEQEVPPRAGGYWELVVAPGQTVTARVRIERHGFDGRVEFGTADAGRNLPHGVYVDNIGLNGLLIVEGQTERTFFITAADWVPETSRLFHLRTQADGQQTTWPVRLRVATQPTEVQVRQSKADESKSENSKS